MFHLVTIFLILLTYMFEQVIICKNGWQYWSFHQTTKDVHKTNQTSLKGHILFQHSLHTLKISIRAWRKKSSTVIVSFKIKILGTKNLGKKNIKYCCLHTHTHTILLFTHTQSYKKMLSLQWFTVLVVQDYFESGYACKR